MRIPGHSNGSAHLALAITLMFGLHYLVTPSEAGQSIRTTTAIRLAGGVLAFLSMIANARKLSRVPVEALWACFVILVIWLALCNNLHNVGFLGLFVVLGGISFAIVSLAQTKDKRNHMLLSKALDLLAIFWIGSLVVQGCSYFFREEPLDVHGFFHPLSEAHFYEAVGFFRLTGVHIEPGTYANWLFGLIILRSIVCGKMFDRINLVAAVSIPVALSAWGVGATAIYFAAYIVHRLTQGRRAINARVLAGLCALAVAGSVVYTHEGDLVEQYVGYLTLRSDLEDTSGIAKVRAYEGFSKIYDQVLVFGRPFDEDFCGGCDSPQDAGLGLNLVMYSGWIFTIAIYAVIGVAVTAQFGIAGLLASTPLIVAKYFYYEPLFWLIFGICLCWVAVKFKSRSHRPIMTRHRA